MREDDTSPPFGEYGTQKAAIAELLAAEAQSGGLVTTVLQPGHISGPGWPTDRAVGKYRPGHLVRTLGRPGDRRPRPRGRAYEPRSRNHPPLRHCRAGLSWDWHAALAAASLLEAALQHVAALPRDQTPARLAFSRSRAPARPGRPRRRQPGGTPWRNGCRRENAGRAPCEPSGNGSTGSAD